MVSPLSWLLENSIKACALALDVEVKAGSLTLLF